MHLPVNKYWKKFKNIRLKIFEEMIKDIRKRFEEACESEIIAEVSSNDFLKRCSEPSGIDWNDNYFDLGFSLRMHFYKIGKADFRDLLNKIIYVELNQNIKKNLEKKIDILMNMMDYCSMATLMNLLDFHSMYYALQISGIIF